MDKSMRDLHRGQARRAVELAWQSLADSNEILLPDIEALLRAENDLYRALNNGRTDERLTTAIDLTSSQGREAAIDWFAQLKNVILIAHSNMYKAARLNGLLVTDGGAGKIGLIDKILAALTERL